MKPLRSIKTSNSGVSAAEYALILAVVGGAIAIAAVNLGSVAGNSIRSGAETVPSTSTASAGDARTVPVAGDTAP